ncbi:MAG: hypothetical protein ACD_80C00094G0001 [uncultured bacterium (gcode 4)]|uniref:Uncharacterized protein n=1 Tax=uncultured bacterium (gcode 4) TaxID=1234023 RepID=K1YIP2_9BACT|nr:MAG: hypothetical protein ACD_80C00094G0001 [uncultured bacterium (gcode 4)]
MNTEFAIITSAFLIAFLLSEKSIKRNGNCKIKYTYFNIFLIPFWYIPILFSWYWSRIKKIDFPEKKLIAAAPHRPWVTKIDSFLFKKIFFNFLLFSQYSK